MPTNLFWDSCVFYAFLKDESDAYDIGSIEQYLRELREGKHKIYTSDIHSINDFAKELIASIERRYDAIDQDFAQKIAAIDAHMVDIRSEPEKAAEPAIVALQRRAAAAE